MNRPWGTEKLLEADDTIPVKPGSGQAPWEKYASSPTSGPWEKYGAAPQPEESAPVPTTGRLNMPMHEAQAIQKKNTPIPATSNKDAVANFLPTAGGTLGGGIGTLITPGIGTAAGSAFGSVAGERAKERLLGQKPDYDAETKAGIMGAASGPLEDIPSLLPSKSNAVEGLRGVERMAKNTPVYMDETKPAMQGFNDYVSTGGSKSQVLTKLGNRIENLPPRTPPPPTPITRPSRLLTAGTEDIPLNEPQFMGGTPSKPITLLQPERMGPKGLPMPSHEVPMSSYAETFPDQLPSASSSLRGEATPFEHSQGMGQGEYIGEIPGERGGTTVPSGVLRRLKTFESAPPLLPEAPEYDEPVNFPEARDFYTNVSRLTRKPGFIRRAIESPMKPSMRMEAGNVREALNQDLTDAASSIGQGQQYQNAMKEYADAAKLIKAGKLVGTAAAGEGVRRLGLLGKAAHLGMNAGH